MRNKTSKEVSSSRPARTHSEHVEQLRAQIGRLTDQNIKLQEECLAIEAQAYEFREMVRYLHIKGELTTTQLYFSLPMEKHQQYEHMLEENTNDRFFHEAENEVDVVFPTLPTE